MASTISQFETLATTAEQVAELLRQLHLDSSLQHEALVASNARFSNAITQISNEIKRLEQEYQSPITQQLSKLLPRVSSAKDSLAKGQKKYLSKLPLNLAFFFEGPTTTENDKPIVKARNKQTAIRCQQICSLNPSAIVLWAATFPPTAWTAGFMLDAIFAELVRTMEGERLGVWFESLVEVLRGVGAEELGGCEAYQGFLRGKAPVGDGQ
jgi:hypothetical protein